MAQIKNSIGLIACLFVFLSVSGQCDLRDSLQKQYRAQIGVVELTGNNDGEMVEEYLATTDLGDGYPWCAAFIYWNYVQFGHELIMKYPAYAPSYFPDDNVIYTRGEGFKCPPQPGDVIGIYFSSKKRIAHVGFYDGETEDYFITVEGNTNDAGSREGQGVYRKYRPKGTIYKISSFL